MTYEELAYCVDLEKDISRRRDRVKNLNDLKAFIEKVAGDNETVDITICAAAFVRPIAVVRTREFKEYLDDEICDEDIIIRGLERKLFEFSPAAGEH